MKKKVFGIILAVLVFLPVMVYADDYSGTVFGSADANMNSTTLNGSSIVCPKSEDRKTATCYIGIRVTSGTVNTFTVTATLTNMEYDSIEEMNNWSFTSPVENANKITFTFNNRTGVSATNSVLVAKVTYTVTNAAEECRIQLSASNTPTTPTAPTENPVCKVDKGAYYCKDGKECSKAQYDSECVPENPTTGSFIPYVVVLGGIAVASGLYFATRKKAKMYHV